MDFVVWISVPIIAFFGILGFRDGVVKRALEIIGLIVTIILTARFASAVNPWFVDKTDLSEGKALLITWAVMILAGLLLSKLLATVVSKTLRLTILGWLDRWGGALCGAAFGMLVASVLMVAMSQMPGGEAVQQAHEKRPVSRFIFYSAPNLYQFASQLGGGKVDELWDRVLGRASAEGEELGGDVKEQAEDAAATAAEQAGV